MAERPLPKPKTRVRFPSSAPKEKAAKRLPFPLEQMTQDAHTVCLANCGFAFYDEAVACLQGQQRGVKIFAAGEIPGNLFRYYIFVAFSVNIIKVYAFSVLNDNWRKCFIILHLRTRMPNVF